MLTLSAVAEAKQMALEYLSVHIDQDVSENRPVHTRYTVRIDMGKGLSVRERAILFNSARSCHVHKMLAGQVSFDFLKT